MQNLVSFKQFGLPVLETEMDQSTGSTTQTNVKVVDKKTGTPTDDIDSLVGLLKDLDKSGEEVKESNIYEQAAPNPFKPVVIGEKSDRVKIIQKYLGIKEDGQFGPATKESVEKFQAENKLKVDGKVGEQTYGKMLEIKMGIKDQAEKDKKIAEFTKMTDAIKVAVDSIIKDPRFYGMFESVTIVVIEGQTRIICVPSKDAKEKASGLKKDGLLTSNYLWVEKVGEAIGKAIVYTIAGPIIVSIELGKAMINGAISAGKFVAKSGLSVISSTVHGIAQIGKWVSEKGSAAYMTLKNEGQKYWKDFCDRFSRVCKNSKEAILAFAGAANNFLGKTSEELKNIAFIALGTAATAAGLAWKTAKTLDNAVREGFKTLASKGAETVKNLKKGISDGYAEAKTTLENTGNTIAAGTKSLGKSAVKTLGDGIKYVGDQISSFGTWVGDLAESLYLETGDPIFEELIF